MTSQQTDYAHNALVALMNIARATGQDYPNLAAHALNEAVEIGTRFNIGNTFFARYEVVAKLTKPEVSAQILSVSQVN